MTAPINTLIPANNIDKARFAVNDMLLSIEQQDWLDNEKKREILVDIAKHINKHLELAMEVLEYFDFRVLSMQEGWE